MPCPKVSHANCPLGGTITPIWDLWQRWIQGSDSLMTLGKSLSIARPGCPLDITVLWSLFQLCFSEVDNLCHLGGKQNIIYDFQIMLEVTMFIFLWGQQRLNGLVSKIQMGLWYRNWNWIYLFILVNKITISYLPRFRTCRQFRFPDWSAPPNTQMLWGVQEGMKLACSYRGRRLLEVAKSHWWVPRKHFTQFLDWGCQWFIVADKLGGGWKTKKGLKV